MQRMEQSRPLWEAREYESHFSRYIDDDERPLFHLSPLVGWMNDPNGFSYHDGEYHLFYQYNPYATTWAPMHWGHAVSKDLLTWRYLPAALAPDMPYDDKGGCFSGSAITLPSGRHALLYTGVSAGGRRMDGTIIDRQEQCLALGDGVDYVKYDRNPVIDSSMLPEGAFTAHFRDPKIWREEDGTYRCVVANLAADKSGQILLYSSEDVFKWKPEGILAKNEGRYGVMWECPDFFKLDGKDVLLVSPQDMLPDNHRFHGGNNVIYLLGHVDEETGALVEEAIETVDHGIDFYATQTVLTPDGRRVMIAWLQNWDTVSAVTDDDRWFGQMSVPRELSVRNGRLYQWPVRELEGLRTNKVSYHDVTFTGTTQLDGVEGRYLDLELTVRSADVEDPYQEFTLWFAQNDRFHTSLRYRPKKGELKLNRTNSGSRRAHVHRRKCLVGAGRDELRIRLVLDRNCAELFINGGETTISVTIPTTLAAQGISFYAEGNVVMDVEKYDLQVTTSSDSE